MLSWVCWSNQCCHSLQTALFPSPVPAANTLSSADHEAAILADLVGDANNAATYTTFLGNDGADWVSVFGQSNADFPKPAGTTLAADDNSGTTNACTDCPGIGTYASIHGDGVTKSGHDEWKQLFGGEVVGSQYQDGHFVYQVVKGGGTGDSVYPPTLYVADIENATHFNNVLMP